MHALDQIAKLDLLRNHEQLQERLKHVLALVVDKLLLADVLDVDQFVFFVVLLHVLESFVTDAFLHWLVHCPEESSDDDVVRLIA